MQVLDERATSRSWSSKMSHSAMPTVLPALDDLAARDQLPGPERAQEVDLQLERRERLARLERREERHPHRRVGEVAEDAAVERAHRVRVALLGDHRSSTDSPVARRSSTSNPISSATGGGNFTASPPSGSPRRAHVLERLLDVVQRRSSSSPSRRGRAGRRGRSRASRGKSTAGTWSPPCETRMRARRSKSVLQRRSSAARRAAAGRCRRASRRGRASRAPAPPSPAGRRRRRRSRAARPRRCASRRSASPPRASARRGRARRSRRRRRSARPGSPASPTAPQPITPTRAPGQTCAVSSTEPTPVATAQPIRQRLLRRAALVERTAARLVHDRARRERAEPQRAGSASRAVACSRGRVFARGGVRQRRASPRAHQRAARRTASASRGRRGRPTRTCSTPGPTASTTPAPSCPSSDRQADAPKPVSSDVQVGVADARSPRCGRAPRPGPARRARAPRRAKPAELGQDDAAIHVASRSRRRRAAPTSASVRSVSASELREHRLARPPARRRRARTRRGGRAAPRPRRAPAP